MANLFIRDLRATAINKSRVAQDARVSRSTVYHAFDPERGVTPRVMTKISSVLGLEWEEVR